MPPMMGVGRIKTCTKKCLFLLTSLVLEYVVDNSLKVSFMKRLVKCNFGNLLANMARTIFADFENAGELVS